MPKSRRSEHSSGVSATSNSSCSDWPHYILDIPLYPPEKSADPKNPLPPNRAGSRAGLPALYWPRIKEKYPQKSVFGYFFGYLFAKTLIFNVKSGERGIRTPGGVTLNGFQDRRNRPLCHLSKDDLCISGVDFYCFSE